jgi:hypothetical protein
VIKIIAAEINYILSEISKFLPFLIPYVIIEYGLMIFALVILFRNEAAYLPKWGWALIIIFFGFIGPIVFLIVGRKKDKEND